jgi:hypothetical protein
MVYRCVARPPAESVTVALAVNVPAVVGVPLTAPVLLALNPSGRPVIENEYGDAPPVALTEPEYAAPTTPSGSEAVPNARDAGRMVIVNVAFTATGAVTTDESVAATRKENCPAVVGVPEIAPELLRRSPSGKPEPE